MNYSAEKLPFSLYVAGIRLNIWHVDDGIQVNQQTGSRLFFYNQFTSIADFRTSVRRSTRKLFPHGELLFSGQPWGDFEMPYRWQIQKVGQTTAVFVEFDGCQGLNDAMVVVDPLAYTVDYYVDAADGPLVFDVYENPLGILLTIYLAHFNNGVVIHASGIDDCGQGYLFTGVSGIGKSTMARLWQQAGATIVNDDRLVVMPRHENYVIANTPMPYYEDLPKEVPVKAIFLLSQSPDNWCQKIDGARAIALLMANCMQHFHSKPMVKHHLEIISKLVQQVPVYELGFKPDGEVVEMIRASTGSAPGSIGSVNVGSVS